MSKTEGSFSLIELAIAISVLCIGVLALIMLVDTALEDRHESEADTHIGLFADGVMAGLRAISCEKAWAGGNAWQSFWADFSSGATSVTVAASDMWLPPTNKIIAGEMRTLVFSNNPLRAGASGDIVNFSLRYLLDAHPDEDASNRVDVTLKVWPGELGSTRDDRAFVFYSEFDEPGGI